MTRVTSDIKLVKKKYTKTISAKTAPFLRMKKSKQPSIRYKRASDESQSDKN